jgi:hypothetical protein
VWGGRAQPGAETLACDGASDPACDYCVRAAHGHGKVLGDFSCGLLRRRVERVCQFDAKTLACPVGEALVVLRASWGRAPGANVCADPPIQALRIEACGEVASGNATQRAKERCDGRTECALDAEASSWGDGGCAKVFKYLEVEFACEATAEGSVAGARAPRGALAAKEQN